MADTFDPYHVWLGIPPEERPANHYRLLGLREFETNSDVITNALDQRRAHLRSVQSGKRGLLSQQLLNEVSAAGVCLLDAAKKQRYDDELRAKLTPAQPAAAPESPIVATSVPLARVVSAEKVSDATAAATPGPTRPAANSTSARQPMVVASPFTAPANTVSPAATAPARASRSALPQPLVLVAAIVGGLMLLFLLIVGAGGWMLFKGRQPSRAAATPPAALPTVGSGLVPAPVTSPSASTGAPMLPPRLPPAANDQSPSKPPAVTALAQGTVADSPRFALVFTGKESVEVPLPPDLTQPDADFTIEMWAQWDVYEPAGKLFGAGSLGLYSRAGTNGAFNRISLVRGSLNSIRPGTIQGGKWVHLAVTQKAQSTRLFIDGKLVFQSQVGPQIVLRSPLLLGNLSSGLGPPVAQFSGLIRDLRVSRGCRYASDFQPESRFGVDAPTTVLLDLTQPREWGPTVENATGQTPPAILNGTRRLALTPQGEVAAELPDGTVDLLRAFNIDDHSLEQPGTASPSAGWAQTGTLTGRSRYLIPYRPPAEYDVEMELTRMEGNGGAFLGLEIAGQPAIVVMGAFPQFGRRSGIIFGLIKSDFSNAQTAAKLQPSHILFVSGVPQDIKVSVRQNGRNFQLTVAEGGHRPVPITGDFSVLACPPEFAIPTGHGISFGSIDAKIRFHKLILRPVNKDFSPEMLAAMAIAKRPKLPGTAPQNSPPAQPTTSPSVATPTPSPIPAPAPQPAASAAVSGRLQVPSGEKLAAAVEEARKIYEPRFKQATKSAAKAALAKEIQTAAETTSSDPIARYALFDLSRKVNVQAGEVQRAIALAKRLEQEYEIPPQEIVVATAEALDDATLTSEQRSEFVKTAADLADAALAADLYERADKLAAAAVKSSGRLRDANLRKEIGERRAAIARALKGWNAVQPSLATLKTSPSDAAANLVAGKFYCLTLEDFDRGLPLLAAGDDAALSPSAKLDLAANDAALRCAAAEAWRQVEAKIVDREERLAVQRRERWLLQQSLGSLQGLDKIKASKRLEELKDAGQLHLRATKVTNRVRVTPVGLLIGRVQSNGTDAGLLVTYEHGYLITAEDFARLMAAGVSPGNVKIVLEGNVIVPSDQVVSVWHDGGTSQGGVHRIFLDDREVSFVGDGHSKRTSGPRLQAGTHLVRWELNGGDFGTAQMEITLRPPQSVGTKVQIPLVIEGPIQAAARSLPTKATIHFGKNTR